MARMNVNPTRMQLKTLKGRLSIAVRGHKLLKDKSDEMIRRFSMLVKKNYKLREEVESEVRELLKEFCLAKSFDSNKHIFSLFAYPNKTFMVDYNQNSVMNVSVPNIEIITQEVKTLPYSYVGSNPELDILVQKTGNIVPRLMELASIEKTCQILASEIDRTKRRVNALEFVMIPQLKETIKYIAMKIEENDRASRIRLIKVKSIIKERNT